MNFIGDAIGEAIQTLIYIGLGLAVLTGVAGFFLAKYLVKRKQRKDSKKQPKA